MGKKNYLEADQNNRPTSLPADTVNVIQWEYDMHQKAYIMKECSCADCGKFIFLRISLSNQLIRFTDGDRKKEMSPSKFNIHRIHSILYQWRYHFDQFIFQGIMTRWCHRASYAHVWTCKTETSQGKKLFLDTHSLLCCKILPRKRS